MKDANSNGAGATDEAARVAEMITSLSLLPKVPAVRT